MRSAALISIFLLTGCAAGWTRPGATPTQAAQDKYQCQMEAAAAFPVLMNPSNTGYQGPARTNCKIDGSRINCTTTPTTYTPPPQQSDANEWPRQAAINSCLEARGYTYRFN
jgi:hypothetical protein